MPWPRRSGWWFSSVVAAALALLAHAAPTCEGEGFDSSAPSAPSQPPLISRFMRSFLHSNAPNPPPPLDAPPSPAWEFIPNPNFIPSVDYKRILADANAEAARKVAGMGASTTQAASMIRAEAAAAAEMATAAFRASPAKTKEQVDTAAAAAARTAEDGISSLAHAGQAPVKAAAAAGDSPTLMIFEQAALAANARPAATSIPAVLVADAKRQTKVRDAFRHAMVGYVNYAWCA